MWQREWIACLADFFLFPHTKKSTLSCLVSQDSVRQQLTQSHLQPLKSTFLKRQNSCYIKPLSEKHHFCFSMPFSSSFFKLKRYDLWPSPCMRIACTIRKKHQVIRVSLRGQCARKYIFIMYLYSLVRHTFICTNTQQLFARLCSLRSVALARCTRAAIAVCTLLQL